MNIFNFRRCSIACVSVFLCLISSVSGQQSASSASVSRSRAISNSGTTTPNSRTSKPNSGTTTTKSTYTEPVNFTPPDEVAVEEFVNYHKHRLPLPKVGQGVAMDVRWGNNEVSRNQREAVLQIGFTTAEVNERTDLRPLNLALVIDKSGSMSESNKMSRVKESLRTMVDKLSPNDIVSIVVFDSYADVLFPATKIGNGYEIKKAIDSLEPNGSTNLHSGLMLGYKEAQKNFRKDSTNRVILLTDGIANVGVIEPNKISAESSEFNGQGIDLSTIGVGLSLNNDLLRNLAKSGRGLYHFISDYKDIDKVFVDEVQSLVSSVAKKVEVSVEYNSNLQVEQIYGYAPRQKSTGFSIDLDNMNNGLTQVVMTKFRVKDLEKNSFPVKVRLSYFDSMRKKQVENVQEITLNFSNREICPLLADVEVKKNFTIAELSQSLFEMTKSFKNGKYKESERFLNQSTAETNRRYPNMEDKDIRFILDIIENYQTDLRAFNRGKSNGDCGECQDK
jgi:Ca-activated chloride channel homolog